VTTLGLTAGASTPEVLVQEILQSLARRFTVTVEEIVTTTEGTQFNLPRFSAGQNHHARQ